MLSDTRFCSVHLKDIKSWAVFCLENPRARKHCSAFPPLTEKTEYSDYRNSNYSTNQRRYVHANPNMTIFPGQSSVDLVELRRSYEFNAIREEYRPSQGQRIQLPHYFSNFYDSPDVSSSSDLYENSPSPELYKKNLPSYEINDRVALWHGDITKLELDGIVSATARSIQSGTGVAKAIIMAGGPDLMRECKNAGLCQPGKALLTKGHDLLAKYVLHTVGPANIQPSILRSCYLSCLEIAATHNPPITTIAFPCIGAGGRGYPRELAAKLAMETIADWLHRNPFSPIIRIIFCTYEEPDREIYNKFMSLAFPFSLPQFPIHDFQ